MVEIILPHDIQERIHGALLGAGRYGVGGILMGKHVGLNRFRIVDISIQKKIGTFANFVRGVSEAILALKRFFKKTRGEYRRFNYLGEWHSHPSFSTKPSVKDLDTMYELVEDSKVGANFAVLLIVRLAENSEIESSASVFWPDGTFEPAKLILKEEIS